jgi:hypothetical protein
VRYRLTWSASPPGEQIGATPRVLVNDRDYVIRIERGYLVTRSMELVECPKTASRHWVGSGWQALESALAPHVAYAGHSVGTPNPAAITIAHVESLTEVAPSMAGSRTLLPQEYCQVHYLIARADNPAVNLPHDVDMVDSSLFIQGTYRARDASGDTAFALKTTVANGIVVDLFPVGQFGNAKTKFRLDLGTTGAEVVFRRNFDRIFDGVDFATMPDRLKVQQILKNLIDTMEVEVGRTKNS